MRHSALSATALLLAFHTAAQTSPAIAQSTVKPGIPNRIAQQLVTLNETMSEVQELLERQLETQTLDLLLKRAQLSSAEVTRLDRALRRANDQRASLEKERLQLSLRAESLDDLSRSRRDNGPSDQEVETRQRNVRVSAELVGRRLRNLEADIVDLEGRLESSRRDLESWQEVLDRRLSGV